MKIIQDVRRELLSGVDLTHKAGSQIIFKGDQSSTAYGVRVPVVRKIAAKYYPAVKTISKKELFNLVEWLLRPDFIEEAIIGFSWIWRRRTELEKKDFAVFERWVDKYINNW